MTDKHKGIITKNFEVLASNLTPDNMLNNLVSEEVINTDEQEELLRENSTTNRAGKLLRLLLKREDRTFCVLIEACKKYSMAFLGKLLEDAGRLHSVL